MPAKELRLPNSLAVLLLEFGERLRLARLRRHMTMADACDRADISRMTLHRAESGSTAVTLGTYLQIMAALNLESDLRHLANKDSVGRMLQDAELPRFRMRRMCDLDVDDE